MNGKYILIDVGHFGFSAHEAKHKDKFGSTTTRLSGYDSDIDRIVKDKRDDIIEGCVIIDKAHLYGTSKTFTKDVLNCPLVNVGLKEGETEECPEPSEILLSGLQGSFKAFAQKRASDKKWSGLDYCSIVDYAAYWSNRGARVGVWHDGQIKWSQ